MFQVSDKVVCVENPKELGAYDVAGYQEICKGPTVYVVRDVYSCPHNGSTTLRFTGIANPMHPHWKIECGYKSHRFRKLSEVKAENAIKNKRTEPVKGNR